MLAGRSGAARIERCLLDDGVMYVPNKTARQTGVTERPIYLSEEAKAMIRERIGNRTQGHVFMTDRGKAWTYGNLEQRWWKLVTRVPVPDGISLYSYRRGWVSAAINDRNVNPAHVAQLAGHSLDVMMKHYLATDPEALKRAVEAITRK